MKTTLLGDIAAEAGRKAGSEQARVYSVTKYRGFVPSDEYFNKQVFSRDLSNYKLVEKGTFAYATIHLDEGSIGIAPQTALISPMYTAFKVDPERVEPRFLLRFLKSPRALQSYTILGEGSANRRRSIPFKRLATLDVPLPELGEQRRIADILDEADALRAKRRESNAHLDALGQSIFHEMFGSPVGPTSACVYARLGDLGTITTGNTPPRSVSDNYGEALEWVKTDNINSAGIGITQAAEGLSYQGMKKARIVESGSILMTCIAGSPRVIGNVALADRRLAFNQQINAFTPASGEPYYWLYLLMAMKPMVQKLSTGGMTGLVSKSSLSGLEVPVQDEHLQEVFAHRVSMVENSKSKYRAQLAELDALFLSLQDRAFKGEL